MTTQEPSTHCRGPIELQLNAQQRRLLHDVADRFPGSGGLDARDVARIDEELSDVEGFDAIQHELRAAVAAAGMALVREVPVQSSGLLVALLLGLGLPSSHNAKGEIAHKLAEVPAEQQTVRSQTRDAYPLHTDNTMLVNPHDYVCYACTERAAGAGGESLYLHVADIVERLRETAPAALALLEEPVYPFPLQDPVHGDGVGHLELPSDLPKKSRADGLQQVPLLKAGPDGPQLRYLRRLIDAALAMGAEPLSERHAGALRALDAAIAEHDVGSAAPANLRALEPGDAMFLDNRAVLHGRTALTGHRVLLRLKATRDPEMVEWERKVRDGEVTV